MTIPRHQQISLDHTSYYHCTARCVRRAFLCGHDRYSGKNFDHRRQWLEDRLKTLSNVFAIDLLAYAIMSNHYHVIVRINLQKATDWSDAEVIKRWSEIYSVPEGNVPTASIVSWRARLSNLSWFMRCMNEQLARRANREDDCKGRFWEGRFKSQALLDESALLRCMAYVDLNPIRAGVASTPVTSNHTSIQARIGGKDEHLLPFHCSTDTNQPSIPISSKEYLLLVDWTGELLRTDNRGAIGPDQSLVLQRLGWETDHWLCEMRHFGRWYYRAIGSFETLNRYCEHLGQRWLKGGGERRQKFGSLLT